MITQATPNGDNRVRIGTTAPCRAGIGADDALGSVLTVGGTSQLQLLICNNNFATKENHWVTDNGRIFERADAFDSLNVVSTAHNNSSLQSNRSADPTSGTIAVQLDGTNGMTIKRGVVNNQTFT